VLREARPGDIERALAMAEAKRRQCAVYHPIFHCPAPDARAVQAPWFRTLIERSDGITLVHEGAGGIDGFVAATPMPGTPLAFWIDDFVAAQSELWPSVGRMLLDATRTEATRRGGRFLQVNCQPLDGRKRHMLVEAGLVVARLNMVNHDPLALTLETAARPETGSIRVRRATERDVDQSLELVLEQLALYHRHDPAFYRRLPDKRAERDRLQGSVRQESSICLASDVETEGRGLLVADVIPRIPVYDPGGPVYFVHDLVVSPGSWHTIGRALITEAMRLMVDHGAAMVNMFAMPGERGRTETLHAVGLSVVTEFFQEVILTGTTCT